MINTIVMKKRHKVLTAIICGLLAVIVVSVAAVTIIIEPRVKINGFAELDRARLDNVAKTVTILDIYDNPIVNSIYDNNKIYTKISELPAYTPAAFVAIEDKRFYNHNGVDYLRVLSAAKNNIFSKSLKEGASTISQQLIKNTHLKNDKTFSRKIQEIRIARDLERNYDKSQILEMYLNILYFGNNIYGIGTASEIMFGKPANELTLAESATLAGIINSPAELNPYVHPEKAVKRRNLVLKRMKEQSLVTETDYESAIKANLILDKRSVTTNQYVNNCIAEAQKILMKDKADIFGEGFVIGTYFNDDLQSFTDNIVSSIKVENGEINVIISENKSGSFIVNSSDSKRDLSNVKRQPGSTLKPFVCYAPALEAKTVYPITPILDEKTAFDGWIPSNYNDKYYGWVSVEDSLSRSLNIPAVKLMESNGVANSKNIAKRFGIEFDKKDNSLALALGAMCDGVTLNTLADAYRALSNGGKYSPGRYIRFIKDKNGNYLYRADTPALKYAISEDNAYLLTKMLQKCAECGTAKQIKYAACHAAAKTGTVGTKDGNTDAYCISYTPYYTIAVRIGAKGNEPIANEFSGGTIPAKICKMILKELNDKSDFFAPETVIKLDVDLNELKVNHKVLLAGDEIEPEDKISAYFSGENIPRVYSNPRTYIENDSILDNFDNFTIVD